jgi:hypothetical protein
MDRTLENSAEHRLFTLRSGTQTERQTQEAPENFILGFRGAERY